MSTTPCEVQNSHSTTSRKRRPARCCGTGTRKNYSGGGSRRSSGQRRKQEPQGRRRGNQSCLEWDGPRQEGLQCTAPGLMALALPQRSGLPDALTPPRPALTPSHPPGGRSR